MRFHSTINSYFGQMDPTADISGRKVSGIGSQVLFPKCLFQDGVFDFLYFKCFTAIIDHFFPNWLIFCHLLPISKTYTQWLEVVFNILKTTFVCFFFLVVYYIITLYNSCLGNQSFSILLRCPAQCIWLFMRSIYIYMCVCVCVCVCRRYYL